MLSMRAIFGCYNSFIIAQVLFEFLFLIAFVVYSFIYKEAAENEFSASGWLLIYLTFDPMTWAKPFGTKHWKFIPVECIFFLCVLGTMTNQTKPNQND